MTPELSAVLVVLIAPALILLATLAVLTLTAVGLAQSGAVPQRP